MPPDRPQADQPRTVSVVHRHERFVVVDKPSGLLSVPGKGPEKADCVVTRVAAAHPGATGPLTVHRLDMETSGLMIVALDPEAQRELSGQFERREVEKRYEAVIAAVGPEARPLGVGADGWGEVELPIRPDKDNRPMQIHDPVHGRAALTRYRVLGEAVVRHAGRATRGVRMEFAPVTGRSHQLRIHAAHPLGLGRPILGDPLYGDASTASRLLLHATSLRFRPPGGAAPIMVESPAPF